MDNIQIKNKLKKYLFFVSIVFFILIGTHLIYNYIYFDSKEIPQKGGIVSESFIGKSISLNPLKINNSFNSYINHILYRSLLTYNPQTNEISGDLAKNCNKEDLSKIECFLSDNLKWSNGDDITIDDIIATYDIIRKTNSNPYMKNILDNIKIEAKNNIIVFTSEKKDINNLNILFQEIIPKKIIDNLDTESINKNFSPIDGIYSGKYKISNITQDKTSNLTKLFLEKNNLYINNPVYINNIIIKIYNDYPSLLKQKDNITIFNDTKYLIGDSIPKLKNYKYHLKRYVSIFLNKDKIEYPSIRNYILQNINIEQIINNVGKNRIKEINSPFLDGNILTIDRSNKTLKTMLNSLGYYQKNYYLEKISNIPTKLFSQEVKIEKNNSGSLIKDKKTIDVTSIKKSITKQNYNSKSKTILSPEWVDKYNFITNPNITLEGKINNNTKGKLYINDVEIGNYEKGKNSFSFKLGTKIGNIKKGKNTYNIFFITDGKKELIETIYFYYNTDKKILLKNEEELITNLINEKIKIKKEENNKIKNQKDQNETINIENQKINIEKKQSQINLIKNLNDNFYYNKNYEAYNLNFQYIGGSEEIEKTAIEIKKQLETLGIKINLTKIKQKDLLDSVKNNKETYHILLTGINLEYFNANLAKYFYSGQISKGINFSKIKNSELDDSLEDLKSNIKGTNIVKIKENIINILRKENIFKPIYTPYYSLLVSKNINGYKIEGFLPKSIYRFEPLNKSYILKEKIINSKNKNILGFIKYLINNLF